MGSGQRISAGRSFLVSDFQHRNDGTRFHKEYASGLSSNPSGYAMKLGQFSHTAAMLTDTKHVIRSSHYSPSKPWLK